MKEKFNALKKKIFGSLSKSKRGGWYHLGSNPSADWLLILIGFLLCAAATALFSVSNFQGALDNEGGDSASAMNASSTPNEISRALIDRVTKYYEERRTGFNTLLETPASLPDPSR